MTKLASAQADSSTAPRTNFFALVNKNMDESAPGICQLAPISSKQASTLLAFFPEWTGPTDHWVSYTKAPREKAQRKNIRTYIDTNFAGLSAAELIGPGNIAEGIFARAFQDLLLYKSCSNIAVLDRIEAELNAVDIEARQEVGSEKEDAFRELDALLMGVDE